MLVGQPTNWYKNIIYSQKLFIDVVLLLTTVSLDIFNPLACLLTACLTSLLENFTLFHSSLFNLTACLTLFKFFYISKRISKANKKYLKSHDPKQESKHICLDVKNLYANAICKFLPTSRLKWIDPKDFDSNKYSSNSSTSLVLQVQNYMHCMMIILCLQIKKTTI